MDSGQAMSSPEIVSPRSFAPLALVHPVPDVMSGEIEPLFDELPSPKIV